MAGVLERTLKALPHANDWHSHREGYWFTTKTRCYSGVVDNGTASIQITNLKTSEVLVRYETPRIEIIHEVIQKYSESEQMKEVHEALNHVMMARDGAKQAGDEVEAFLLERLGKDGYEQYQALLETRAAANKVKATVEATARDTLTNCYIQYGEAMLVRGLTPKHVYRNTVWQYNAESAERWARVHAPYLCNLNTHRFEAVLPALPSDVHSQLDAHAPEGFRIVLPSRIEKE